MWGRGECGGGSRTAVRGRSGATRSAAPPELARAVAIRRFEGQVRAQKSRDASAVAIEKEEKWGPHFPPPPQINNTLRVCRGPRRATARSPVACTTADAPPHRTENPPPSSPSHQQGAPFLFPATPLTMATTAREQPLPLWAFAVLVRLAVVGWACAAALLGLPYDTSGIGARPPPDLGGEGSLDGLVDAVVAPLTHWDGVHFTRISHAGYEFEQHHAFFPLFPAVARAVRCVCVGWEGCPRLPAPPCPRPHTHALLPPSPPHRSLTLLWPLTSFRLLGEASAVRLSCVLTSNVCVVLAALVLLALSRRVIVAAAAASATTGPDAARAEGLSRTAVALFCLTPAGVFMSAAYTER
jgi:hypothetical protein